MGQVSKNASKGKAFEIEPQFSQPLRSGVLKDQVSYVRSVLMEILPEDYFETSEPHPIFKWNDLQMTPDVLNIQFFCTPTQENHVGKIFLDLIKKWLIPDKEIQILSFQNLYFYLRQVSTKLFFFGEVKILVENGRDLLIIEQNLPLLAEELKSSLFSRSYVEHILDTKALSLDQKSTQIHQQLRRVIKHRPAEFDQEVFHEMSRFLAVAHPEFRKLRSPNHITRLVASHYLMRKQLQQGLSLFPEKRHLAFRFIRTQLHFPFGSKPALGMVLSVGLTDRYETFEDTHVLSAVQKFIPKAQVVKGSYYSFRANHDPIKYLYLELEKEDGGQFSQEEITKLKNNLDEELKKRIEKLIPSVFMIRNEEEIMRNILLLSQELKYLSDLPQVMVNFEKQTVDELCFIILVVRVLKKHDQSLENSFEDIKQPFRFISDRVQNVGYVRKKNPKEANVFHLWIPKEKGILRADSSVNFYSARQKVISILNDALGEVRDYNGGMILKQGELFTQFLHSFKEVAEKNQELLENFFFSLNPIEAQATLSIGILESLFKLFLEATEEDLPKRESYFLKNKKRKNFLLTVLRTRDRSIEPILTDELNHLENFSKSLIKTQIPFQGSVLHGYIYEASESSKQKQFQHHIDIALRRWHKHLKSLQELRLAFVSLPLSLDPRLGGDEISGTILKMLFEGLTRIGPDNKPALAIAKSVDVSPDGRRYTFKLRSCLWSDGSSVVARDFEYAWKKILTPQFDTSFAYVFFSIKNAQLAKQGKIELDRVGVTAIDDHTLKVELENPTPQFLELTAHALYSPVKHSLDKKHPNWAQGGASVYVCNGPFKLHLINSSGGFEFVKNPMYWDKQAVKLDKIRISEKTSEVASEMFKNDEIDWIGRPMTLSVPNNHKKKENFEKESGTYWCVFNVDRFPFNHFKMRQAFFYAIDREDLASQLPKKPQAAITPLPLHHTLNKDPKLTIGNKKLALELFEESLQELGFSRKTFPVLTLVYLASDVSREKTAILLVKQWRELFGISFRLEAYDFQVLFSKLVKGDFQMGNVSWKAWINDPHYTLGPFMYRDNRVNFARWEHPKYQENLNAASREIDINKRLKYFKAAEKILIEECPVLPIIYDTLEYMHKPHLKGAFFSVTGNVDFKSASIVPVEES